MTNVITKAFGCMDGYEIDEKSECFSLISKNELYQNLWQIDFFCLAFSNSSFPCVFTSCGFWPVINYHAFERNWDFVQLNNLEFLDRSMFFSAFWSKCLVRKVNQKFQSWGCFKMNAIDNRMNLTDMWLQDWRKYLIFFALISFSAFCSIIVQTWICGIFRYLKHFLQT